MNTAGNTLSPGTYKIKQVSCNCHTGLYHYELVKINYPASVSCFEEKYLDDDINSAINNAIYGKILKKL